MNRFLLTVLFCLYLSSIFGQEKGISDSIFQIQEVTISSNRMEYFSVGNTIRTIDSSLIGSYTTANLSQVLSSYSQVQINSYGLGLSNPSIRGTGSSHTAVLWNGFNLQDLLNGGVDFSLIPINFIDDIKVQYGGCSALFGSGAIGGVIHLNNTLNFEKGLSSSISAGYGSYDNIFGGLNLGYSNASYSGLIKSFYGTAQNDFKFRNEAEFNSPIERQKNAERKQYGILTGNGFKLSTRSKIENFFWFQDNDINIAPNMVSQLQDNWHDRSYRVTTAWKTWGTNSDLTVRSGFSDNIKSFDNKDNYHYIQTSNQAEYNLKLSPNHLINAGIDYTYEKAIAENLTSNAQRNRFSLFASYRFTDNNDKWNVATNFREELIDQNLTPITFSIGFEHAIASYLQLKGVLSKNFRIPTFDDLYWKGWGNPNLKNESGFNQDLGFRFSKGIENINLRYELTGFSNMVSNWILWEPSLTGSDIWTPENVSKVWARGIENNFDVSVHMNSIVVKSSLSYSYTCSTKVKADIANDPAVNKQLIYVPKHKGLATINVIYKGFTLYYGQSYTGSRYTMKDNSKYIRPYSLGNISLTKNFKYRQKLLSASIQINNIWNTVYQVMEWYPMPLRNYQLNIKLNFK